MLAFVSQISAVCNQSGETGGRLEDWLSPWRILLPSLSQGLLTVKHLIAAHGNRLHSLRLQIDGNSAQRSVIVNQREPQSFSLPAQTPLKRKVGILLGIYSFVGRLDLTIALAIFFVELDLLITSVYVCDFGSGESSHHKVLIHPIIIWALFILFPVRSFRSF